MAHAALYAAAEALAPCATVSRSMFRPTRAIQISVFKDAQKELDVKNHKNFKKTKQHFL
jgi:hypothetical protein